ncbi:MAG: PAS domain-containing protein [Leptolyngbyaceae bacterium]|nr:PAS domain-containing protein [Leptolyngbyaceae bacterium]
MPIDLKHRIFTKVTRVTFPDRLLGMAQGSPNPSENPISSSVRFREAAFDTSSVPQIVINSEGILVLANERAQSVFGLSSKDLGRPIQDLEISYKPLELRSCIEQVYGKRSAVNVGNVQWQIHNHDVIYFDVQISPLIETNGKILGVVATFLDVTRSKRLQEELEHSNQELEVAYEELQSANEELETTNEELQSTNEELETTNEELQSTNEELETMNEELQSTNEELQTINGELSCRSEELNQANAFLASILSSLKGGVVVLDPDLCIQIWSTKSQDMWGLQVEEVEHQHFLNLDIGLPVELLRRVIRECLAGHTAFQEITLEAVNRRGKLIQCKVTCTPLYGVARKIEGAILIMEEVET